MEKRFYDYKIAELTERLRIQKDLVDSLRNELALVQKEAFIYMDSHLRLKDLKRVEDNDFFEDQKKRIQQIRKDYEIEKQVNSSYKED